MVKRTCAFTGGLSNLLSRPPSPFTRAHASADKSHPRWRSTQTLTFSGLGFFEPSGLAQRLLSLSSRLARTWCCGGDSLGGGLREGRRKREGASEAPVVRPSRVRVLESARAKVSVKSLALGLKGKVGNDVVKPSERSKVWQWASAILGLCNGRVSVKGLASG